MYVKTRTNQGGSVINFLIVGVILAAIALAALFFAQQRGSDVAKEPRTSPGVTQTQSPSPSIQAPTSSPRPSSEPSRTPAASPSPSTVPQTGVMPETGPGDNLLLLVAPVALLSGVFAAYIRSRRATS